MKAKEIAEGVANYILGLEDEVSETRMKICNKCEHHSKHHKTRLLFVHCTICKCPLATKTRSLGSECPDGRWPAINTKK